MRGFNLIHKADLINILLGLYEDYDNQNNVEACRALDLLARMLCGVSLGYVSKSNKE